MSKDKQIDVGMFCEEFNKVVSLNLPIKKIVQSKGLATHLIKQKHFDCLKYIDKIPDIIASPDYIGINPNEKDSSIELVKVFKDNVLIGIKFDKARDYFYVSTMFVLQESKFKRRTFSGRIKPISIDKPPV